MGYLSGTDQYISTFDSFSPVPWFFDEYYVAPYNKMAAICKFRTFVDKKSKAASRKRLAVIVYKNATLLGGSKRTDKAVLMRRFFEHWMRAMDYLISQHKEEADSVEILGRRYCITMSCWQFLEPDISNIIHMSGLKCGTADALAELEVDRQKRMAKKQAIQRLEAQWREVIQRLAYKLQEAEQIEMLTPAIVKALATIEDEIDWLASDTHR